MKQQYNISWFFCYPCSQGNFKCNDPKAAYKVKDLLVKNKPVPKCNFTKTLVPPFLGTLGLNSCIFISLSFCLNF